MGPDLAWRSPQRQHLSNHRHLFPAAALASGSQPPESSGKSQYPECIRTDQSPAEGAASLADSKRVAEPHQKNPGKEGWPSWQLQQHQHQHQRQAQHQRERQRQRLGKFSQFMQGLKARPRPIATHGVLSPSSAAPMVHPFQRHSAVSLSLINPLGPWIHSIRNQRSMRPGAPVGLPSRVITA